jgi:hypothetical protein
MLNKILGAIAFLVLSLTANAGLVHYGDYTLNEDTNIVTGNDLEWLQWNVTYGMSTTSALTAYSNDGWVLASNLQMSSLLNSFEFNTNYVWSEDENIEQKLTSSLFSNDLSNDPEYQFINLFGQTWGCDTCAIGSSAAWFGDDADGDGKHNAVDVLNLYKDFRFLGYENEVSITSDTYFYGTSGGKNGVALVRSIDVPEPSTFAIFALGILGLVSRKFIK